MRNTCKVATPRLPSDETVFTSYGASFMMRLMDKITFQIKRVQRFVAKATMTKTALAELAGLPLTTLIGMERAEWNPSSATLKALVRALDSLEGKGNRPNCRDYRPAA